MVRKDLVRQFRGSFRFDLAPADHQPADDLVLAQQRHRQNRMDAFQQSPAVGAGECGILLRVVDMDQCALDRGAADASRPA